MSPSCAKARARLAAGMAKAGLRPFVAIYSTFLQRAYDQVFQEVALQNLPVVFCMDRAGLVGQDGPTHNGVFDLAYLRTLPNVSIAAPRDATDMRRLLELGAKRTDGPLAIRYPRDNCPAEELIPAEERREMVPGRAETLLEGEDVVLWASGALVRQAREAVELLRARGVHAGLVDARFIKPLDEEALAADLRRYRHLFVLEEHQRAGGFGSAVLEAASRLPETGAARARIRMLGVPDRYVDHMTTREEQLATLGLDAAGIERAVQAALRTTYV